MPSTRASTWRRTNPFNSLAVALLLSSPVKKVLRSAYLFCFCFKNWRLFCFFASVCPICFVKVFVFSFVLFVLFLCFVCSVYYMFVLCCFLNVPVCPVCFVCPLFVPVAKSTIAWSTMCLISVTPEPKQGQAPVELFELIEMADIYCLCNFRKAVLTVQLIAFTKQWKEFSLRFSTRATQS